MSSRKRRNQHASEGASEDTADPPSTSTTSLTVPLRSTRGTNKAGGAGGSGQDGADAGGEEMRKTASGEGKPSGTRITLRMRHASSEVPATAASNDPNNAGDLQSGVETRTPAEVKADGMTLWRKVVDFTDKEGNTRSGAFMKLPSRKDYPDYYEFIKRPISFAEIKSKLGHSEYTTLRQVGEDIKQIFVNAKRYNQPGSGIFDDAKVLHKALKREFSILQGHAQPDDAGPGSDASGAEDGEPKRKKLKVRLGGPKPASSDIKAEDDERKPSPAPAAAATAPSAPEKSAPTQASTLTTSSSTGNLLPGPGGPPTVKAYLRGVLAAMEEVKENDKSNGRRLIRVFEDLPDRVEWKQYYEVIPNPIAFGIIRMKNEKRQYKDVQSFVDDVEMVFQNAMYFNEDGSAVWKDAKALQKRFEVIIKDQPTEFQQPIKRGPYQKTRDRMALEAAAANAVAPQDTASPGTGYDTDAGTPMDLSYANGGLPPPSVDDRRSRSLSKGPAIPSLPSATAVPSVLAGRPAVPSPFNLSTSTPVSRPQPTPAYSQAGLPQQRHPSVPVTTLPGGHTGLTPTLMASTLPLPPATQAPPIPSPLSTVTNGPLGGTGVVQPLPSVPKPPPVRVVARLPEKAGASAVTRFQLTTVPACTIPLTLRNDIVHQHALTVPRAAERLHIEPSLRVFEPPQGNMRKKLRSAATDDSAGGAPNGTAAPTEGEDKTSGPLIASLEVKVRPKYYASVPLSSASAPTAESAAKAPGTPSIVVSDGKEEISPAARWIVELAPGPNVVEVTATKPKIPQPPVAASPAHHKGKDKTAAAEGEDASAVKEAKEGEPEKEIYRLFIMRAS